MSGDQQISDGITPDRFGHVWPRGYEICGECGQPDNCGDCSHGALTDDDVEMILGYPPCPVCHSVEPDCEPTCAAYVMRKAHKAWEDRENREGRDVQRALEI